MDDGHGDSDDYLLDNKDGPPQTPLEIQTLMEQKMARLQMQLITLSFTNAFNRLKADKWDRAEADRRRFLKFIYS